MPAETEVMDPKQFVKELLEHFPTLERHVSTSITGPWDCSPHMEMTYFRDLTQTMIDYRCTEVVEKCFAFLERCARYGDNMVADAALMSCLEHLDFTDTPQIERSWAEPLLCSYLKERRKEIFDALDESFKKRHPS